MMKVISGFLKGRKINGYNIEGTRPTQDRVKESLMASIQLNIKDAVVLDLFAGSGQLGIETISNGSKCCYFVDNNPEVIKILKNNIRDLEIMKFSKIFLSDWKRMLNEFGNTKQKFDLIFVDPPYDYDVYDKVIRKVNELDLLNDNGLLILEYGDNKKLFDVGSLTIVKEKKYGYKHIMILKKEVVNELD